MDDLPRPVRGVLDGIVIDYAATGGGASASSRPFVRAVRTRSVQDARGVVATYRTYLDTCGGRSAGGSATTAVRRVEGLTTRGDEVVGYRTNLEDYVDGATSSVTLVTRVGTSVLVTGTTTFLAAARLPAAVKLADLVIGAFVDTPPSGSTDDGSRRHPRRAASRARLDSALPTTAGVASVLPAYRGRPRYTVRTQGLFLPSGCSGVRSDNIAPRPGRVGRYSSAGFFPARTPGVDVELRVLPTPSVAAALATQARIESFIERCVGRRGFGLVETTLRRIDPPSLADGAVGFQRADASRRLGNIKQTILVTRVGSTLAVTSLAQYGNDRRPFPSPDAAVRLARLQVSCLLIG